MFEKFFLVNIKEKGINLKSIENLDVYKRTHKLTLNLYKITKHFPQQEKYGLTNQIRRAAASINSNLMEGAHRNSIKEYIQFAAIARGSSGELKYQLLLAKDLNYINEKKYYKFNKEINDISKMIAGLIRSLKKKTNTNTKN